MIAHNSWESEFYDTQEEAHAAEIEAIQLESPAFNSNRYGGYAPDVGCLFIAERDGIYDSRAVWQQYMDLLTKLAELERSGVCDCVYCRVRQAQPA